MTVEHFVKGSDNAITLTLTEDGVPIAGAWSELDVYIGVDGFNIGRAANGDGVTLLSGVLTIKPAQLTEDLAALPNGEHRVFIRLKTASNPNGAHWGADDSEEIVFVVSDPPG